MFKLFRNAGLMAIAIVLIGFVALYPYHPDSYPVAVERPFIGRGGDCFASLATGDTYASETDESCITAENVRIVYVYVYVTQSCEYAAPEVKAASTPAPTITIKEHRKHRDDENPEPIVTPDPNENGGNYSGNNGGANNNQGNGGQPNENNNGNSGNNNPSDPPNPTPNEHHDHGNHYGNDTEDHNPKDVHNPHDGEDTYEDHHDDGHGKEHKP